MATTNFFSSASVSLPISITNSPQALLFTVGNGSASIFEVELTGVKFVTNVYAFDSAGVQTSDFTTSSSTELVTVTFSSSIGVDSRSVIIEYVPNFSTSVVVSAS